METNKTTAEEQGLLEQFYAEQEKKIGAGKFAEAEEAARRDALRAARNLRRWRRQEVAAGCTSSKKIEAEIARNAAGLPKGKKGRSKLKHRHQGTEG
jgi:hypothetical protein